MIFATKNKASAALGEKELSKLRNDLCLIFGIYALLSHISARLVFSQSDYDWILEFVAK